MCCKRQQRYSFLFDVFVGQWRLHNYVVVGRCHRDIKMFALSPDC
jgi:hypothetical protein